ncbi:MAG: sulfite exporter TauE/SafE family protein [Ignavibacteria bacterium]|nr:sulfite exporter TauE/SafE family protein [Ignavibacteria bacterium]MBT8383578.1 sulfite exporter TauE/SafE family protein [Ignavibacteria bacterium]MBT8390680.1 sulfite exporter TauE/SafE family protein [Ignavibacteria bacterium]NNJ51720.1 sulfite exporter TauE/SafE family protein [Ignavibacteriaceae bacterium]NNL20711.1 sulfite exporter TauE/SafE family protein [Ignavibacteriaceae bacterium]
MSPEILTAFLIGFLGSFHCIGMCGPIAVALPVPKSSNLSFFTGRILYNLGRVVTYSFLGALFGLLGSRITLAGAQQVVSIILGVVIIIAVLLPQKHKNFFAQHPITQKLAQPLKANISVLFQKGTFSALFLIGILNGFLPCGFVYIGLAGSIASGDAVSGAAVMVLFGLGTVPVMFAVSIFGKFINIGIRTKLRKAIPVFAILLAAIFILRGMNLGIPYLSPKLSSHTEVSSEMECH